MKKIFGILLGGILFFSLTTGALAQTSPQEQMTEEAMKKLSQEMALLALSLQLNNEGIITQELINALESFKTEDQTISKKIQENWLPALRNYLKMIESLQAVVEKFSGRKDLIPEEEIKTEFEKVYSGETEALTVKVLEEMKESGILEKLLNNL